MVRMIVADIVGTSTDSCALLYRTKKEQRNNVARGGIPPVPIGEWSRINLPEILPQLWIPKTTYGQIGSCQLIRTWGSEPWIVAIGWAASPALNGFLL